MHVSIWNVALQTVNFLVLAWLLQRFLFKPVRAALAKRQTAIEASLRDADQMKTEADRVIEEYRQKAAGIGDEAAQAREQAVAAAEGGAKQVREEAVRLAKVEIDRARASIERERAEALRWLEARAAELATCVAERLLRETLPDSDAPFLWRATASIDALDARDRATTAQRFASGPVEAVSSRPLDGPTRERFERWLSNLAGTPVRASYHVDSALIAGIELRLPTGVWRANWRDALDRARAEMIGHETAA
jgi:F-type H+-transporting ATPase subunit b